MELFNGIDSMFSQAFDASQHGFLSGNWDDFTLGINRVAGIVPNAIASNANIITGAIGQSTNNILAPLNYNPSFWILAIGGILVLLIGGFVTVKVLKYV